MRDFFKSGLGAAFFIGSISFCVLAWYHNIFWFAPDEGVFAHISERVNNGDVIGVDFYTLHPGLFYFWNAFLFKIFSYDLVVMRYPLVVLFTIEAALVTYMLRDKGFWFSSLAGFWVCIFGFIQFLNPSPNWYGHIFAFFSIFILAEFPKANIWRYVLTGLLIALTLCFRHPCGIFLGMGVLTFYALEAYNDQGLKLRDMLLGKAFLVFAVLSLIFFNFLFCTDIHLFFYLGVWPVLALSLLLIFCPIDNVKFFRSCLYSAFGAMVVLIPFFSYIWMYSDFSEWLQNSLFMSARLFDLDTMGKTKYWYFPFYAFDIFFKLPNLFNLLNAIFWAVLYSVPIVAGIVSIKKLSDFRNGNEIHPAFIIPLFYGYVGFYLQVPIYLYFMLSLCALAIFIYSSARYHILLVSLSILMIYQSLTMYVARPLDVPYGVEQSNVTSKINRASLYISEPSYEVYNQAVTYIKENSSANDSIFAYPNSAEFYFLSERKNPTPYIITCSAIHSDEEYDIWLKRIEDSSPKIIVNKPGDKYNRSYERRFTENLHMMGYNQTNKIGPFVFYMKVP